MGKKIQIQKPEEPPSPFSQIQVGMSKSLSVFSSESKEHHDQEKPYQCSGSSSVGTSDLLSRASSSDFGDYIGMESCIDVFGDDIYNNNEKDHEDDEKKVVMNNKYDHHGYYKRREERWARIYEKKEFPPPIPLLVRTENLPSHMPWVLKRHYTSDGRLILTEEKVRHHEYFRAHRSNGRLTLHLVPMDDDVFDPQCINQNVHVQDHDEQDIEANDNIVDEFDKEDEENVGGSEDEKAEKIKKININEAEDSNKVVMCDNNNNSNNNNNEEGKRLEYYNSSVRSTGSSCILSVTVPLPAIRPVHTS